MLLVVPLVAITGFPQCIPHFSALAFDDDDDLPWPPLLPGIVRYVLYFLALVGMPWVKQEGNKFKFNLKFIDARNEFSTYPVYIL